MSRKDLPTIKVCILGETGVGKTCISNKLIKDKRYVHNYLEEPTIGAAFMCRTYEHNNNNLYKINIWDTAGQERYRSLAPMYYRDTVIALVVYDITNYESWSELDYWINELRKNTTNTTILLIGNKYDLVDNIKIHLNEIEDFTRLNNDVKHIFFSAKKDDNCNKILDLIIDDYEDKIKRGIMFNIPLYSPKNTKVNLDKERYWCSNSSDKCC